MKHLKYITLNESLGDKLFREIDREEWYTIMPTEYMALTTLLSKGRTEVRGYRAIGGKPTDPAAPLMVPQYLEMIKDTVGIKGDITHLETIVSVHGSKDHGKRYHIKAAPNLTLNQKITVPEFMSLVTGGVLDVHMISVEGDMEDHLTVVFLEDDWVAVRFLGNIWEGSEWVDVYRAYRCDGVKGVRQCLDMIKGWKK